MTADKRWGAGGFDDDRAEDDAVLDGARDNAGDDSGGGRGRDAALDGYADGYDGAPDDAAADPTGPADADPFASELSAIFAAALAGEPPSRVTAESVLREIRGEKRSTRSGFASWLVSGRAPSKWAGGLIAVAALVAAVIVVAPMTGSSPDGASTAASGVYDSSSGSSESSAAAQERVAAADSAGGIAAAEAPPESGQSESSAGSESSQEAPGPGAYTALSDTAASDGHDAAGGNARSSEASGPASSGGDSAAQSSPGVSCELPALTPEEWSAAVATLPSDVTTTRLEGTSCVASALRGNGIEVARGDGQPDAFLWLVVSQGPLGSDGAASDSLVVSTSRGGVTVRVVANESGSRWLDDAALQRLVDAVADAQG